MSFSCVESALYVHGVWVRRRACASAAFGGEAQTTRIATVWTVTSIFCPRNAFGPRHFKSRSGSESRHSL